MTKGVCFRGGTKVLLHKRPWIYSTTTTASTLFYIVLERAMKIFLPGAVVVALLVLAELGQSGDLVNMFGAGSNTY